MTESGDDLSLDLVTAALRADSADLAIYARVLTESLSEALPPGTVSIDRKRSASDRMRGRPGEVSGIVVRLGDQVMSLSVSRGQPAAEICREVRGVVLSADPGAAARVDGRAGQRARRARRAECRGGPGPAQARRWQLTSPAEPATDRLPAQMPVCFWMLRERRSLVKRWPHRTGYRTGSGRTACVSGSAKVAWERSTWPVTGIAGWSRSRSCTPGSPRSRTPAAAWPARSRRCAGSTARSSPRCSTRT